MKKFNLGSIVKSISGDCSDGLVGTVVYYYDEDDTYLVNFGKEFDGHDGGEIFPNETCWWLLERDMELVKGERGFEVVVDEHRKTQGSIVLPIRGTSNAMAYDFYANDDYVVEPNKIVKIWTDVKAYMQQNEGLIVNVRSSMGGKFMLANTCGWIDADYYSNSGNDGNIGVFLMNISDETQYITKGDRIAQGMFINYLVADNGNTDNVRAGGFGSTN